MSDRCCCGPSRGESPSADPRHARALALSIADTAYIPGGTVSIGTRRAIHDGDGEAPMRSARIQSFRIDKTAVTNRRFAEFVAATGYITEAEHFGWSFVFFDMLPEEMATQGAVGIEWWRRVDGAAWHAPQGPGTTYAGREDHPVTHVTWSDAVVFAEWAGGRLPSEAEWEHAARGGLSDAIFPWGDREPDDTSFMPCNIWQGQFPMRNTAADGHRFLAPAQSFEPNGYGLYNMVGNSWEWCADRWRVRSLKKAAKTANARSSAQEQKLMKGGSFLCHRSYCYRYRIAARHGNTPDTSTSHIGFRVVYPAG